MDRLNLAHEHTQHIGWYKQGIVLSKGKGDAFWIQVVLAPWVSRVSFLRMLSFLAHMYLFSLLNSL